MSEHGRAVAIVSGASSGIGAATAQRLALDGYDLVLMADAAHTDALSAAIEQVENVGATARMLIGDISEPETSARAVDAALSGWGRVDCVVNNAGIYPQQDFLATSEAFYDRMMAVNVRGMYMLARACARAMTDLGGGSMVCTASSCSFRALESYAAYNVSKGAVAQLTRSLAVALSPYGIRVNAVAPGLIASASTCPSAEDPGTWSQQRSRIPADRLGKPEEVASVISFLLSDAASYVNGAIVAVDGGESAGWRSSDWSAAVNPDFSSRMRDVTKTEPPN